MECPSQSLEVPDNVIEVDPPVTVEVEVPESILDINPLHIVEEDHNIVEVRPPVAVQVLVQAVAVRISRFRVPGRLRDLDWGCLIAIDINPIHNLAG